MKRLVFLMFMLCEVSVLAQKLPDFGTNRIRISTDNSVIQAELLPVKSDPEIETDCLYYWYSSNQIHTTQGGFSGRLLNGHYIEYYPNKNIKEEGVFNKGLKDGIWKNWDPNGVLLQRLTWKNGIKQGEFIAFNKGAIRQQGKYKSNKLNGMVKTTDSAGKISAVKYKEGIIEVDSPSKFWTNIKSKARIFKNKKKSPKPSNVPVSGVNR